MSQSTSTLLQRQQCIGAKGVKKNHIKYASTQQK